MTPSWSLDFPVGSRTPGVSTPIARFGDFKLFRLERDIWEPIRVCAQREVARVTNEETISEYRDLIAALENDAVIGQRLGDEVVGGAGLGGSPLQANAIAMELALEPVHKSGSLEPSAEIVASTISRWLAHLRRDRETVVVLAPLAEFVFAAPPIEVFDGVAIDLLTSDEIAAALRVGSWPVSEFEQSTVSLGRFLPTVNVEPTFAIRTSYTVPVVVGGGTPERSTQPWRYGPRRPVRSTRSF
jgi:hypothetical protein